MNNLREINSLQHDPISNSGFGNYIVLSNELI